jgi:hypothetical protein
MSGFNVAIGACGTETHLADLRSLHGRNLAIPHDYASWPLNSTEGTWRWCRVTDADDELITGFAVHLTASRAIPGTRIGRIDRIGRELHAPIADRLGPVLNEVGLQIPRLLRLDVRIFDEDPARRHRLRASLAAAGWSAGEERRQYSHTLVLELGTSREEVLKGFTTRVRSTMKKALASPGLRFAPIVGDRYAGRIRHLHTLAFARTGVEPPPIDVAGILRDSAEGTTSLLVGAFAPDVPPPDDLLALLWGRLHGDHAVLEINASDRSPLFKRVSPGFGLMSELIDWSLQHNVRWIDLGGLHRQHATASDPMRGIIEFKSRFSTDFREIAEEWHLAPRPFLAAAASAIRSIARTVTPTGNVNSISAWLPPR